MSTTSFLPHTYSSKARMWLREASCLEQNVLQDGEVVSALVTESSQLQRAVPEVDGFRGKDQWV